MRLTRSVLRSHGTDIDTYDFVRRELNRLPREDVHPAFHSDGVILALAARTNGADDEDLPDADPEVEDEGEGEGEGSRNYSERQEIDPVHTDYENRAVPDDEVHIHHRCALLPPPAHLAPELGFTYPLDARRAGDRCRSRCDTGAAACTFPVCVAIPPSDYIDNSDRKQVGKWIHNVCEIYRLPIHDTLMALYNNRVPDHVKLYEHCPEGSDVAPDRKFVHVIAFFRSAAIDGDCQERYPTRRDAEANLTNEVYPVDITFWYVRGKQVHTLRCVREPARSRAFAKLSAVIEDIAPRLSEGELKELYDAAKGAYDA